MPKGHNSSLYRIMDKNTVYYSKNAERLSKQYDELNFECVHKDWLNELPSEGMALDVGAGSGRDARYMASHGLNVVAVEPAEGIREIAQQYDTGHKIHWLSDSLPELKTVFSLQTRFNLILLSAVWMHIAPSNRNRCIRKLSSLLKPNGKLIISLRLNSLADGESQDDRKMHEVSASELSQLASQYGLTYRLLNEEPQKDEMGRHDITWQTVLLQLPDDGTGAFPLIRNIVVNDTKSSTYKVALLRCLLRIAEGHPGAVIDQDDEYVVLPMGLVSLYWLKLYKPLIDQHHMQQNSNSSKGLGFIEPDGWEQLNDVSNNDFYIGASHTSKSEPLYLTLKHISSTIKSMPAKYTKLPNSNKTVFQVELNRTAKPKGYLALDFDFLTSLGKFYVPRHVWDSLTRFSIWIEPALVNEWATIMSSFALNKERKLSKLDYLNALHWDAPQRTTYRVRKRVEELLNANSVNCCWTGFELKKSSFEIDHAFPFTRWPNNDLWNLLPSKSIINTEKSDKLPSSKKLNESRDYITSWWRQGWQDDNNEFFTQASFALPNLPPTNRNFDDVFEAFSIQRDRIKDFQQLEDW